MKKANNNDLLIVSRRLKELRQSKNLTQQKIARLLCVDRSTYSYYETGKTQPSLQTLLQLSDFYDVSLDYLAGKITDTVESADNS